MKELTITNELTIIRDSVTLILLTCFIMHYALHYSSFHKCFYVPTFILGPFSVIKFRLWILTCSHTRTVHDKFNYLTNVLILPALESQNIYCLALFILPEMFLCAEIHIDTLLEFRLWILTCSHMIPRIIFHYDFSRIIFLEYLLSCIIHV